MSRRAWLLVAATLGTAAVFTAWPGIDLHVSGAFRDPATGRWTAEAPVPALIRNVLWRAGEGVAVLLALLFLMALFRRGRARVPARLWGFGFLSLALGPGVLINVVLKEYWGRARPRTITEFGGEAAFTPALQLADQCLRNCSFVSGEVAMTATLSLILWLVLSARMSAAACRPFGVALASVTVLSGFLRVAGGGHFLSDVLLGALLPAVLTLALWRLSGAHTAVPRLTRDNLAADLRAPFASLRK